MNAALTKNNYFVKEQIGAFKASNNYDVYDPQTQELIMTCREENLGIFTKILRFSDYKKMTPFDLQIRSSKGELLLRVKRGMSFMFSEVEVFNSDDLLIGYFKQKFSFGGKFEVLNSSNQLICTLTGNWKSWEFSFSKDSVEFAKVSKKWAGIGKEFFTSADNYMLQVSEKIPNDNPIRQLIVAAVFCIDLVLKE
ncbi:MAG: RNAase [Bacteroidetes bacterium]|nr:RNAase [Bacteroidota bacterium]